MENSKSRKEKAIESVEKKLHCIVNEWGGSLRSLHVGEFRVDDIVERGHSLIYQIVSIESMDTSHMYKAVSRAAREAYSLGCTLSHYELEPDIEMFSLLFKDSSLSRYFLESLSNLELKDIREKGVSKNVNSTNSGRRNR